MKKGSVAKRYAKALIELGQEEKRFKEIGNELRDIAAVFAANPEFKRFALNPMYKLEERLGIVEKVATALGASDVVKRFLSLLVETRGIGIIEEICAAYSRMEDELAGRIEVKIESAVELNEGHINEIKRKLSKATKKEIILTLKKNPAHIGGLVFRIGNTILDGSIKTQLEKVREKLYKG
ncbi:MAG: ATP synthase F1 subunit delta [Deltaproteobacteria bacterium]|nr:ATP synthase F1 subunit delta [Deltaproteobacteria bacterium]